MTNQVFLIGRLANEPIRIGGGENENGFVQITIAVSRSYKNIDGVYGTDFIKIKLFNAIANNTIEYCRQGDLIGVKGRVETIGDKIEIIADKVTFLSSRGSTNEL